MSEPATKTICIERPSFLSQMSRETNYRYEDFDISKASPHILRETVRHCQEESLGGPTAIGNYLKASQCLDGAILAVDQRVSRDLEISTVAGDLSRLAFPAAQMEVRFADPDLPAILLCRIDNTSVIHKGMKMEDGMTLANKGILFSADTKSGATLTLALPDTLWPQYVSGQWSEDMRPKISQDMVMEDEEAACMKYLALLAVKVLAYASCSHLAPTLVTTKAEKKAAGIHPKHVLPHQKTFVVRYLPHVIREKPEIAEAHEPSGKTRRFMGRAGRVVFYEHERYTRMRGVWQWQAPIAPPDGVRIIYRVRKAAGTPVNHP
jgi:hypothetical protein